MHFARNRDGLGTQFAELLTCCVLRQKPPFSLTWRVHVFLLILDPITDESTARVHMKLQRFDLGRGQELSPFVPMDRRNRCKDLRGFRDEQHGSESFQPICPDKSNPSDSVSRGVVEFHSTPLNWPKFLPSGVK